MPALRVALAAATAALAVAAAVLAGPAQLEPAAAAAPPAPSAAHPYSAPVYSPLRTPATISCVKTNCTTGTGAHYHGYWAIDFVGRQGDPVFATGAGIFHVGGISPGCVSTPSAIERGTWAWVDHGGGLVSKYHHLDAIVATEGQRVTPATQIGRMGHAGDLAPCRTNYLHYEVRTGGTTGTRVNPGSLTACTATGRVTMPRAYGASSFDGLVARKFSTPRAGSCSVDDWNRTPGAPVLSVRRGNGTAALAWTRPPAGTSAVVVAVELWSPSVRAWNRPVYTTLPGTAAAHTVQALVNGRTYRVRVATRNGYGFSAWSTARTVVPATRPAAPRAPRFATSPTRDYIHYGWWQSTTHGTPVSRYVTQVRCTKSGTYQPWRTKTVGAGTYYYNHRGLTGYGTCQVRVRADSAMGSSAWSTTTTVRKRP